MRIKSNEIKKSILYNANAQNLIVVSNRGADRYNYAQLNQFYTLITTLNADC